jgi:hypothetical protein
VLRDLGDAAVDDIAARSADAWRVGDVNTIVAMLADDARHSMPPLPQWYRGKDEIRAFLISGPLRSHRRSLPTTANGQGRVRHLPVGRGRRTYVSGGVDVLTLLDGCVAEIVASLTGDLTRFGLPPRIRPQGDPRTARR